jgi:TetR/AcrR family transcriptional repressor of nem operon
MSENFSQPRGRPREFDADVAIHRAMNAFWSNGYHGTSLSDLLSATRLSKGSLYAAFGDKRGLFLRALDRYIEDALLRVDEELGPGANAVDGLRKFLNGYAARNSGASGRRGCLVVATAMELAAQDSDVEKRIERFFRAVETRLKEAIQRGKAEGSVAASVEPALTARIMLSMVEGLRVIAKTGADERIWKAAFNDFLDRLSK